MIFFFAHGTAEKKPKKFFALRAENKKKTQKHKNTPKKQQKHQKTPKKCQIFFFRAEARKKTSRVKKKTYFPCHSKCHETKKITALGLRWVWH